MTRARLVACFLLLAGLATACAQGDGTAGTAPPTTQSPTVRPSSSGKLTIVSPRPGDTVKGTTVKLRLTLTGARIVPATTKNLRPDEGHLHVLLDGRLITMTAAVETDLPNVTPGSHTIRVEFVAGDHAPFFPRIIQETLFTVTA